MSASARLAVVIQQSVKGLEKLPGKPYTSLVLCVIDAVYSIGVKYESTKRTVSDFCKWCQWPERKPRSEYLISDFLTQVRSYEGRWEALAREVFRNRQRTSSKSGILKAEAVYRFAKTLNQCGINCRKDTRSVKRVECSYKGVELIPGQGSGISFKYFLMLAGHEHVVKPDRMVRRFVTGGLSMPHIVSEKMAEDLIAEAAKHLRRDFPKLTPASVDYRIWRHQREVKS